MSQMLLKPTVCIMLSFLQIFVLHSSNSNITNNIYLNLFSPQFTCRSLSFLFYAWCVMCFACCILGLRNTTIKSGVIGSQPSS